MKKFSDNPLAIKAKSKQNNKLNQTIKPAIHKNENVLLQGKRRAIVLKKKGQLKKIKFKQI